MNAGNHSLRIFWFVGLGLLVVVQIFQKGEFMKHVLFALGCLVLTSCGFNTVSTGHRGLYVRFGNVEGAPVTEGLYFYNPFTTSMKEIDVREKKLEGQTQPFTKDTQAVTVHYAVTFYPKQDAIGDIYKQFGPDWENLIIPQVVTSSIQNEIGQIIADDLSGRREAVSKAAEEKVRANLIARNIIITRLDIVNVDFNNEYEKAVEEKVVAIQDAMKAKNRTVQVQEQAKQTVETAKAQAEAMKIQTEALSKNKALIDYEIAKKWDGKLPEIMMGGGATPMIDFTKLRARNEK